MSEVHYLSMVVMGIASLLFGLIPILFSIRSSRYPLILSLILCLGAGVLLATSLVHMLKEVQTKLQISAELYFCGGFLTLYVFDEITHYFIGRSKRNTYAETERFTKRSSQDARSYGSISNNEDSRQNLLCSNKDISKLSENSLGDQTISQESPASFSHLNSEKIQNPSGSYGYPEEPVKCHVNIGEPCSSNHVAKSGLLIALLIHSVLEGVSIGVQTETAQILLILGAVSFHKVVLSFCLGLELISYGYKPVHFLAAIFLFSIGSPLGIFVGMSVTSSNGIFNIDAQLQALAAGSLLYVAAFEVLPRERFKWQHSPDQKAAGIFQLIFVLLGFLLITLVHLYLAPEHCHGLNENKISSSQLVINP